MDITTLVGTGPMQRSLADFEIACGVYIDNQQQQVSPDNALIALLCDAVRLAREHARIAGRVPRRGGPNRG
jgi:hypothetical protein